MTISIFNTREIAIIIWFLIAIIYVLSQDTNGSVKAAFRNLISTLVSRHILSVLALMSIYVCVMIYFLFEIGLWDIGQLKNTIFWFVFVGIVTLIKETKDSNSNRFTRLVLNNLKFTAVLQFICGVYTFPLIVELLFVPCLSIISAMIILAEKEKEFLVKNILEGIIALFGFISIFYVLFMLLGHLGDFMTYKTFSDFFTPPLLTLFYLPFLVFMNLYFIYENAFVRFKILTPKPHLRFLAKLYALIYFNFSPKMLPRWTNHLAKNNIETHADLINTFKHINHIKNLEKYPKDIPIEDGWSPYLAKSFLFDHDMKTNDYEQYFDNEWFASSPIKNLGDEILADNITFFIEGTDDTVKTLKILLNINNKDREAFAKTKFMKIANDLSQNSLGVRLSSSIRKAIHESRNFSENQNGKKISLLVESWHNYRTNGYSMKFSISA